MRRLQAYEHAGVNALFVPYLKSRDQLDRIAGKLQNVAPESLMARLTRAAEHERCSEQFLKPSTGARSC